MFTDITSEAGVGDSGSGQGLAWADMDGDGDLDLYVSNNGEANVVGRTECVVHGGGSGCGSR